MALGVQSESHRVRVAGRLAWRRRVNWRGVFEIGVEFLDVKPRVGAALEELARSGRVSMDGAPGGTRSTSTSTITADLEIEDVYAILGLDCDATEEDIHKAYRRLARHCHPDVSRKPDAVEKFTRLGKAYAILRDPDARRRYDVMLALSAG